MEQKLSLKSKIKKMATKFQHYTADELRKVFRKSSTSSDSEDSSNKLS